MSLNNMIVTMMPCWMLGVAMIYLLSKSEHKDLLKIDKKAVLEFFKILIVFTIMRCVWIWAAGTEEIVDTKSVMSMIPWQTTLGVFWEDACNSIPLLILGSVFKNKIWKNVLYPLIFAAMCLSFGLGHSYQGLIPAMAMCLYIPITTHLGKRYGFGTVMICHIIYDLIAVLTFMLV